jgi:hypothetical protein
MSKLALLFTGLSTLFALWSAGFSLPNPSAQNNILVYDVSTHWKALLAALFGILAFLAQAWVEISR